MMMSEEPGTTQELGEMKESALPGDGQHNRHFLLEFNS